MKPSSSAHARRQVNDPITGLVSQVEFGETEPRWYQPWLWYDFYASAGSALVHFVCVDTPSLLLFKHNVTEQRAWINDTIGNSAASGRVI